MEASSEPHTDDATQAFDDAVSHASLPRNGRRLSDKVLVAFHHACDASDLEIADHLLRTLELMLTRCPANSDGDRRRRSLEGLVAAHERLWQLRHPDRD